jgi:hypothetical protein
MLSSKPEKIETDGFTLMTCSNRSKNQLIFLSQKQMALQLACFFLIMPQAISIALVMLFLLERC